MNPIYQCQIHDSKTRNEFIAACTKNRNKKDIIYFIDPPYTVGGKKAGSRLYNHCDLDHEQLFKICKDLAGEFLMTYDNASEVRDLARKYDFQMKPVAMKNTHHTEMTELLISRNLGWLEEVPSVKDCRNPYLVGSLRSSFGCNFGF